MGEVYLGRDERLDRRVAIKVLSAPDRTERQLERFRREARAISRVTHPHVCGIYDVGEQNGTPFLVMEFLDGETLAARLEKGPLPLHLALAVGAQIAEALDAGHRQGVIHLDLTPGNVMLTAGGAKLLDFGLARLRPDGDPGAIRTTSLGLTDEGVVFGTLPYLAPEQVEGLDTDARTDIFGLGVTLFEMASGRRPFQGKSRARLAAAILGEEPPPLSSLVPAATPAVDRIIRKCLAKNPDDRWQTARDLASELRWGAESEPSPPSAAGRRNPFIVPRWAASTAAAVAIALAAATATLSWRAPASPAAPAIRLVVPVSSGNQMSGGQRSTLAISPNGQVLVFVSDGRLYLRALDRFDAQPIAGTEGATVPFFSPDGVWLGFNRAGALMKVPVAGGLPAKIIDAGDPAGGAAWGFDDRIIFARGIGNGGLWTVPANGGTMTQITTVAEGANETQHMWPAALPDGSVLYTVLGPSGHARDAKLVMEDFTRGSRTVIAEGVTFGRYLATGHLLYVDGGGTLLLQPFDLPGRRAIGPARGVLAGVRVASWGGAAGYAVSATGTLAFVSGTELERTVLSEVDVSGRVRRILGGKGTFNYLALSPNGRTLATMVRTAMNDDIHLIDLAAGRFSRFSFGDSEDESPVWSPDGERVAFSAAAAGEKRHIVVKPVLGPAPDRIVYTGRRHLHLSSWSPDGRWLAFSEINPRSSDVWLLNVRDPSMLVPVANTPAAESNATFSPNGKSLAFLSDETGRTEVYVVSVPGVGAKQQVSHDGVNGASPPRWSADGRDLFFIGSSPSRLLKATSAGSPAISWEVTTVFEKPGIQDFVPARDGRGFYLVTVNPDNLAREIRVILNWLVDVLPGS
jgi:Tol biopolymer transport system component